MGGSVTKKRTANRGKRLKSERPSISENKSEKEVTLEQNIPTVAAPVNPQKYVSDLEFLDTVKETVYKKLADGELDLKIDSGFKAIELKNKISETSENEKLLLEILSEIRSEELRKSKST